MCKCLSSLIRHVYHSFSNLKKHPGTVLSVPIFLLTFHSFAKQKPLCWRGGQGSPDSALPPDEACTVCQSFSRARCHRRGLWEGGMVCWMFASSIQRIYPICYRQPQITEAFFLCFLNGTACLFLLLYKHKEEEINTQVFWWVIGKCLVLTSCDYKHSRCLLSPPLWLLGDFEHFWGHNGLYQSVYFTQPSSNLAIQDMPVVIRCNGTELMWYWGRGRGQREQRPLFQSCFHGSLAVWLPTGHLSGLWFSTVQNEMESREGGPSWPATRPN